MARNFRELQAKMSPKSLERSRVLADKYRAEMPLHLLRDAQEMTQVHLAKILGLNQSAVSKLERRADMYVSTLQRFVKAMGGELKITARFPEGIVEINQFEDVKKAAAGEVGALSPSSPKGREKWGALTTTVLSLPFWTK